MQTTPLPLSPTRSPNWLMIVYVMAACSVMVGAILLIARSW